MKKTIHLFAVAISLLFLTHGFYSCINNTKKQISGSETSFDPEIKRVFINGDSLHYIDIGKSVAVILVHGSLGDFRDWGGQMDTFPKNYRVIAYSRRYAYPNRQQRNDFADYTATVHAKDLAEFIKALNIGPVHLVGHSYGAFTTLLTTTDHPELVRSLTLGKPPIISLLQNVPGGDTLSSNFISKAIMPAAEAFKKDQNENAVRSFASKVIGDDNFFDNLPPERKATVMDNTLELRGIVFTKNPSPFVDCEAIKKIKAPVLLISGQKSPLFLTSIVDQLEQCLPNKERVILPNSSHVLQFENPADFNKIALGFIDKH